MPRVLTPATLAHGRVLIEDAVQSSPGRGTLVVFHGYGQSAEIMLEDVQRIPTASAWTIVSIQARHRFYARDDQHVIASWMTSQDRELEIADNVEYVDRALADADPRPPLVFFGFSQGVAMAFRAALLGAHEPAGIIALAGDIPPDVKAEGAARRPWPPVLLATGRRDTWLTPARLAEDVAVLESRSLPHESLVFDGGHEWTEEVRSAIGRWLETRSRTRR